MPSDLSIIARDRRLLPIENHVTVNPDKYVLLVALAGRGLIELGDRRFRMGPGDTVLIFPHQAHQFSDLEAGALRWVLIGFRLERAESLLQPLRSRLSPAPPAVQKGLAPFIAACVAGDPADRAHRPDLAAPLWLMLTDLLRQTRPMTSPAGSAPAEPQTRHWKLIEYLYAYLGEHENGPVTTCDLARHTHMSISSLRRQFHAAMGLPLGRYIRGRRLRQAIEFKLRTDATWSETADRFGFGSVYSFSRAFKKEFKLSPTVYQRALKQT